MIQQFRNPILHKMLTGRKSFHSVVKSHTRERLQKTNLGSTDFVPVQLSEPSNQDSQHPSHEQEHIIEIRFPDGIHIILTGRDALSAARSILTLV
ncbi:MAG: hypothetical protein K0B37_14730 [Bacteroidales bacterium]|nr:hypothetical protein [Bacteroidales bacterium]